MKKQTVILAVMLPSCMISSTQASLLSISSPPTFQTPSPRGLITERSVASLRLGMTVAQARKALPGLTLSRTTDGEGLAVIAVTRHGKTLMTLFAGETNPSRRINQRAIVEFIEALDSSYRTALGVHPKMSLRDVERKYGKLTEIVLSEIEAREFAIFANQPTGINLRVASENGMAGVYAEGQTKTRQYEPSAYVYSISISRARNTS